MDFPDEIIVISSEALVCGSERTLPLGNSVVFLKREGKYFLHGISLSKGPEYLPLL